MRLLTRCDFDGLICGALLREAGVVDSYKFVHPKDIKDGLISIGADDVLANVPYARGCGMWFDHHSGEPAGADGVRVPGESRLAPSCARIIYEYYGGKVTMPHFESMVNAVDKVDFGSLGADDVVFPQGWILLGFVTDPRTGLERAGRFSLESGPLLQRLIDACRSKNIGEILALPEVAERVRLYNEHEPEFKRMLRERTSAMGNVAYTDMRGAGTVYAGNRFMVYTLFPEQNISLRVEPERVIESGVKTYTLAVRHSVITRTSNTDVGAMMRRYGGGGHRQAGACEVSAAAAERVVSEMIERMNIDG